MGQYLSVLSVFINQVSVRIIISGLLYKVSINIKKLLIFFIKTPYIKYND